MSPVDVAALYPGYTQMRRSLEPRGPRKMPSQLAIVRSWMTRRDGPNWLAEDDPRCFRCLRPSSEWRFLQRAHLVDRVAYGLDAVQNLAMLCAACHAIQPCFDYWHGRNALVWVFDPGGDWTDGYDPRTYLQHEHELWAEISA